MLRRAEALVAVARWRGFADSAFTTLGTCAWITPLPVRVLANAPFVWVAYASWLTHALVAIGHVTTLGVCSAWLTRTVLPDSSWNEKCYASIYLVSLAIYIVICTKYATWLALFQRISMETRRAGAACSAFDCSTLSIDSARFSLQARIATDSIWTTRFVRAAFFICRALC